MSSESFGATNQRTGYVAVTRGKEQAQIFTDDREALLKAVSRPDNPLSATELADAQPQNVPSKDRQLARRPLSHGGSIFPPPKVTKHPTKDRGLDHAG